MKCTDCSIKPICTIYSVVLKHSSEVGIQINFCNYKPSSIKSTPSKENDIAEFSKPRRTPEEILNTSDKIREIYSSLEDKGETKANEVDECSVCRLHKMKNQIHYTCESCGKEHVCETCITESITDSKNYCPECWDKME